MKSIKKLIAVAILLIIGSTVLFVSGMSALGWDFDKLDTEEFTKKSFDLEDYSAVTGINADTGYLSLIIKNGDKLGFEYYQSDSVSYDVSVSGGVLNINEHFKWYKRIFNMFSFNHPKLILTIPASHSFEGIYVDASSSQIQSLRINVKECEIETSNGDIIIEQGTFNRLELKSSNGDIKITDSTALSADIKTSNGKITVMDCQLNDLEARTSNGKIEIDNLDVKTGDVHTSNDDINLSNVDADSFKAKARNGDISITNCSFVKLDAENSNGAITFNALEVKTFNAYTGNGDITGDILADMQKYSISVKVSNGNSNVSNKQGTAGYALNLKTSNGDINVQFNNPS